MKALSGTAGVQHTLPIQFSPPPPGDTRAMKSYMSAFDAIVFPADDRTPHIVPLMLTAIYISAAAGSSAEPYRCGHSPHPEVYMDYVADHLGSLAWRYHLVEALDGMIKKFSTPYILFYPVVSRDGMPFPVNRWIRKLQHETYDEARAWRGSLVVAKYHDSEYSAMIDASMADFPILKNYLLTHGTP